MAIAFLDLAASIPIKASLYSNMARPLCAEDRLGQSEQPSSRIVGRATSSAAKRTYGHTVQRRIGVAISRLLAIAVRRRSLSALRSGAWPASRSRPNNRGFEDGIDGLSFWLMR